MDRALPTSSPVHSDSSLVCCGLTFFFRLWQAWACAQQPTALAFWLSGLLVSQRYCAGEEYNLICFFEISETWSRSGDRGEKGKYAFLPMPVGLRTWPFILKEIDERTIPSGHTDTKRLTGPVIATFCNRGSSHCVLFISEEREKKDILHSDAQNSILWNNVMESHAAHTVIYVEDSSIGVGSFFPSWL